MKDNTQNSNSTPENDFIESYSNYYPFILKYCTARLGSDSYIAEDCTQETFFILYKKFREGIIIENPKAYLCRIADRIILKRKSKKFLHHENLTDYIDESDTEICEPYYNIEYEDLIKIMQSSLNEIDKQIFTLRYIDDLSVKEIAQKTNNSVTNITTRLSRIRKKIQIKIINDGVI